LTRFRPLLTLATTCKRVLSVRFAVAKVVLLREHGGEDECIHATTKQLTCAK